MQSRGCRAAMRASVYNLGGFCRGEGLDLFGLLSFGRVCVAIADGGYNRR
jgi:hypothetical protein